MIFNNSKTPSDLIAEGYGGNDIDKYYAERLYPKLKRSVKQTAELETEENEEL